jgi:multiple sugar transport system permease protein
MNADKTTVFDIVDKKGNVIHQYNLPRGLKLHFENGDAVSIGDNIATIKPQWHNYVDAWAPKALSETFNTYLINTLIVTFLSILGVIISATFVAYGFARFKFPFKTPLFMIMISTMMIPAQVTMIPTFILFKYLGWIDSYLPLTVPLFFGGGAFNIFLLRQFFLTIPYELDEAAKIDGCNYFQIFYIILLPLVKPALATVAIFAFVYSWNDFLNPLIYLNSSSKYTLALGLQTFSTMYGAHYHLMMAASTIVLLPILIVFFFGQRFFIEGVATSGLKG